MRVADVFSLDRVDVRRGEAQLLEDVTAAISDGRSSADISAVRKYTDLQQDPVKAGQEIEVEAVLDGSIQKAGERVRVTVRLLDVRNGTPLWAEQFDENLRTFSRFKTPSPNG